MPSQLRSSPLSANVPLLGKRLCICSNWMNAVASCRMRDRHCARLAAFRACTIAAKTSDARIVVKAKNKLSVELGGSSELSYVGEPEDIEKTVSKGATLKQAP